MDPQAGFEKAVNGILPVLMQADQISGVGILEDGVSGSYEHVVMDDEIYGKLLHLQRGIRVDVETLAFDAIKEAVLQKLDFYMLLHTSEQLRANALYEPGLAHRGYWEMWEMEGKKEYGQAASEKAAEILATHTVPPLPDEVTREVESIIEETKRTYAG